MIFKGIDITNLSNIEIYNMVLKRQLPTFPPGFWCSVSKECGIKIANELLRYLIDDLYKYSREEIINNVTKEFILNNRLWTPCKLYFGRSPIKYIMAAYPEQFKAYEFVNERIPQGFWTIKENRVEAVRWLIEDKLKWSLEEVKEKFSRDILQAYGMLTILTYHHGNIFGIVNELYKGMVLPWEVSKSEVNIGFWNIRENRIMAIRWLAIDKLKFSRNEIINDLTLAHFYNNQLGTLICNYYNKSINKAILEGFESEIMPWELRYYRLSIEEARNATKWLLHKLFTDKGKVESEVNYYDFKEYNLRKVLDKYYYGSPIRAIKDCYN